jgi:DNA-binding beta-propeller fold protein YncE
MGLRLRGEVSVPAHRQTGGFDHGDVHAPSGRVFVAHLASGTVEVIDGETLTHLATIEDCPEASGVLCCPEDDLVVAAARGAGHVLAIDPTTNAVRHKITVAGRPNGLAWDSTRRRLLVADVAGNAVAIVKPSTGEVLAAGPLPGRSAWATYERLSDRYLVNIRSDDVVVVIDPESAQVRSTWKVSCAGPHGMDLDPDSHHVFIACEDGHLLVLDTTTGTELGSVEIAGNPDAIWFNPLLGHVYLAIGDPGVVQVVDSRQMSVIETVKTGPGAHTLALDITRQQLYVFRPSTCSVLAYAISRS